MSVPSSVPSRVRLRLGHAALQHLADGSRARLLHIKGEALHPCLAADRAPSTDCDVLVHPDDVDALVAALGTAGWEPITRFEHGSVFGHAATFYSPVWGTVDVHRAFPGLDRDPLGTFATLWDRREERELGGRMCAVPDLPCQRLLLLLHAARDAMGRREHDVRAAWTAATDPERTEVDQLADRLGARVPLALATGRPERARGRAGEHLWRAVAADANPTEVWRARLLDARGRERLRLLVAAGRVNPDHLRLRLGHPPSRAELRREWWARWLRGARRLRDGRGRG